MGHRLGTSWFIWTKGRPKHISDYGLIGDLRTCALVGLDGSIDWLCVPRFDSPSVFGAILDVERGGFFRICPHNSTFKVHQEYDGPTSILVTDFESQQGGFSVTDFMPCFKVSGVLVSCGEVHRRISWKWGSPSVEVSVAPKMNYGLHVPSVRRVGSNGYLFYSERHRSQDLALLTSLEFENVEGGVSTVLELGEGKFLDLVLRYGGVELHHSAEADTETKLAETRRFWIRWSSQIRYNGPWKHEVLRSALTLKMLVYAPTGAMIAAPTTSLPEEIGGVRNWDYRYSWLRDSCFALWALHAVGYDKEANDFLKWVINTYYFSGGELQVLLGVTGERNLHEKILNNLRGYMNSKPVRVGNGAWNQLQLDLFGVVLDAFYYSHKHGKGINRKLYLSVIRPLMERVEALWDKPDCGIWEVRGEKLHFVYSKVWCWVAADRAHKIAKKLGLREAERWAQLRAKIKSKVLKEGFDPTRSTFVRAFHTKDVDSANLLMPLVGFIDPKDERFISTMRETVNSLKCGDGLLYRYIAEDGLPGREGAFLLCSFWYATCLAKVGEKQRATELVNKLLHYSNHLGLFSEEVDPKTGELLGNFPQAFTHMGFVMAAKAISEAE
ncbi:MAG: glycoside hydrolase family 15 protein [Thermoprotei archaeon]